MFNTIKPFATSKPEISIVLCQVNPVVGDIQGNAQRLLERVEALAKSNYGVGAPDLLVFPELYLTGYQPEDLLLRPAFIETVQSALHDIAQKTRVSILLGAPSFEQGRVYNSAYLLANGKAEAIYKKQCLPNTGVFDEARYFTQGDEATVIDLYGHKLGVCVCEDLWHKPPVQKLTSAGAQCVIGLNASPYHQSKHAMRMAQMQSRVEESGLPLAYLNIVGGQDELLFDGHSFVLNAQGERIAQGAHCEQDNIAITFNGHEFKAEPPCPAYDHSPDAQFKRIYEALVLGTKDYVNKNGFKNVLIGLSGGIDSALTLAIAVDALGWERVRTVMLPSRYTSQMSLTDAQDMADRLGVRHDTISIESTFQTALAELHPLFNNAPVDTTEENIQARVRGLMLMALSNKTGAMVLTTGNKSEYAVGYATLYGDMCGGFAPIKDVYKTLVFDLCRWRNLEEEIIPTRIIERPPSAELAPDQKDEDSLPPYEILDAILEQYIEKRVSVTQIIAQGFKANDVHDAIRRLNFNEYKRRQSAPGVKVTTTAFGRERRYPITNQFDRWFA